MQNISYLYHLKLLLHFTFYSCKINSCSFCLFLCCTVLFKNLDLGWSLLCTDGKGELNFKSQSPTRRKIVLDTTLPVRGQFFLPAFPCCTWNYTYFTGSLQDSRWVLFTTPLWFSCLQFVLNVLQPMSYLARGMNIINQINKQWRCSRSLLSKTKATLFLAFFRFCFPVFQRYHLRNWPSLTSSLSLSTWAFKT